MEYIPDSVTRETLDAGSARITGEAFGEFEAMLADIPDTLGETIPGFHDMELRLQQFEEAIAADKAGRVAGVRDLVSELLARGEAMTEAERLHRRGELPKRICHCDTKLNNILFDRDGNVLCVIDLDTVMPSFVFSDFGDFLRTAANTGAEDAPDLNTVEFNMDIFKAFAEGYLKTATFLTPKEKEMLPYAAMLFPYMQAVRFLTDYLNGDTYYKIAYPDHNLVRARAQFKLLQSAEEKRNEMAQYIKELCGHLK
ncbi:MAG: aminoglycoside phosphotransferase family protein, partial [Muribaculaceae bacterium]|nr:aminoglycoside phosphotransferase family protein [Muribaculaceae bacterium]